MKTIWSNEIDNILKIGESLSEIGVNNWALQKNDVLNALVHFEYLKIPVLGGDVCELKDNKIKYNYDNWYCEQMPNESKSEFVLRSIAKARLYIENYQVKENKIFFAIVPEV